MPSTAPAYTIGGITRPELFFDANGNIVLTPAAEQFASTYGLKALYLGLPANTPYPPVADSLSSPTDSNAAGNSVTEGAAVNTPVNVTVSATSTAGNPVTYALVGDTSGGGFKIDPATGVVTVADPTKIDYETAAGHAYTVTAQASDGILTTSQTFSIGVNDVAPSAPVDSNAAANSVAEGAAVNTLVGITVSSTDVNGPAVTYSLVGDTSGGGFKIDPVTGVVSVADPTKIDYESSPGHAYTVTAQASDGTLTSTQTFTIGVTDVAISAPIDANANPNTVVEGAANGTTVGITASAIDPNGPATSYSLIDNAGGRFAIDPSTGVVTVANGAAIDFETSAGHAYGITVQATSGAVSTTQTFSIGVTDVGPSTPIDANNAGNSVFEGAANGTAVGITASAFDPGGGPAATYSLSDNAGGRFAIDATTGVVTVANGAAIDYETAAGHAYGITVQATAGALSSTQNFTIGVANVNEAPAGTDKTVLIAEDTTYTFSTADFGFSDPSDSSAPNSLLAVKMTTVPGAGAGTLTDNGITVNAGDSVSAADIAAGHLVFTPVLNANGSPEATFTFQVQDNGGTANGGVDLDQSPNTVTVNVTAVNDAPVNSVPGAQTINEDATLTFSTGSGNAISVSDVDARVGFPETVTLQVQHGTLTLGSTAGLTGVINNSDLVVFSGSLSDLNAALQGLTYKPTANYNGPDSLSVTIDDNGNTGAQFNPLSDHDTVAITVNPVNDAPVNSVPGAQTVNEDTNLVFTGANAITISDVDGGSGDETVTLTVTSGSLALGTTTNLTSFTNNAASITLTGTIAHINTALDGLTYHGNLNFNGADSLSIVTHDNGNTGSGGDLTDTDSVTINVTAVNDAPSFAVGGTQTVLEDSGAHTVNGFATAISPGPADEAGQTVNFLTSNDNNALFTAGPAIDASGNLTYTLAANANGSATVTVQLHDNGGTANGGIDTSAAQTFVINAGPVNDAPAGADNTLTTLEDTSHTFTAAEFGFSDPVDAANNSGANNFLNVVITTVPGAAAGTLSDNGVTLAAGATVTKADIDAGLLKFNPAANANGNGEATFTFQVKDDGGTANGGVDTDQSPNTITFNVTSVNDAPAGTDATIASVGAHTFAASEFGFTDPIDAGSAAGANAFQDVIITTIPGAGTGTLTLNTGGGPVTVTAGESIAVADIGGLVFTPVGNTTGSFTFQVQDNGGTANGGIDTDQSPNSFTIQQNAPPVIDSDGGGATAADSSPENTTAVTTVHATDPDNGPSPLSYSIVGGDDQAKFAINSATGVLTFVTAPDFENPTDTATDGSNTYIVQVQASDGASVDQQTITVTVTNVNEAPTAHPDTTLAVEAGGVANGTAGINPTGNVINGTTSSGTASTPDSDPDAGDTLTVQGVASGNTNAVLTTNVGTDVTGSFGKLNISSTGAYTYTVDNTNATVQALRQSTDTLTDTFSYTIKDAGGLTSTTQVTVTIDGANDNPVANADAANVTEASGTANGTPGTNITAGFNVLTGTGAGSVADTDVDTHGETQAVTGVETGSHLADTVVTGAGAPLTGQYGTLTLNTDGSYTYSVDNTNATVDALNTGNHVDDVFTYTMQDAAGAKSTTTLTIHVNGADDAPVAVADSGYVPTESRAFSVNAATGVLANDTDVDTAHGSLTAVLNAGPSHAASFTLNSDGSFSYTPTTGYLGADSFTYHANDGSLSSNVVTVSLDVQPLIWHIDNSHTGDATQDGSAAHPFQSIAAFDAANAAAGVHPDIVYLHNGTGTYTEADGINLNNGQTLIGQGAALTYQTSASSPGGVQTVTLIAADPAHTPTIVATAGDGIDLAQNNTVEGLHIGNTSGIGIADNGGTVGTLNISGVDINTNDQAVNLTHGGALNVTLDSITSTGGTSGIALGGALTGSFTGTTGTLSGHTTSEVAISGGSGTVSYGGTIGDGSGLSASVTGVTGGSVTLSGNINDGADAGGGITVSGNSGGTIDFTGATKTLNTLTGNAVSLSSNTGATIDFTGGGLDIDTTSGTGFSASTGTVTVTGLGNTINTTSGTALSLSSLTVGSNGVTFDSATTTSAATGISIDTVTGGAINVNGGSIAGATTRGVDINAVQNNISIASSIGSTGGHSVEVTNSGKASGNTITFSGAITDTGGGINLDNNDQNGGVATVNFTGGMSIHSTTNTGFNATNGGTVNVTNGANNSIVTTTGTALNVVNTTIGSSGVTFHDISANGAANGIVLNNTGSTGGLTVTGSNSVASAIRDSSGGTIQNTTGAAISLTNTTNAAFNNVNIQSSGDSGVNGTQVTNFSFTNGTINNAGNAGHESAIAFNSSPTTANNIAGTLTMTGNSITNAFYAGLDIESSDGTVSNATISGNTITNPGFSGVNIVGTGTASTVFNINNATIANNSITSSAGNGIQVNVGNSSTSGPGAHAGFVTIDGLSRPTSDASHIISITGNTITLDSTNGATQVIAISNTGANSGSRTQTNFEIKNNGTVATPLSGSLIGSDILIGNNGYSDMAGVVDNNVIDAHQTAGTAGGGGNGIAGGNGVAGAGNAFTPRLDLAVTNNTISDTNGSGILLVSRGATGTAFLKVASNTVAAPNDTGGFATNGIEVDAGNNPSADDAVFLNIFGNTSAGTNGALGIGLYKQGNVATTNDFGIFDAPGGPTLASSPTNAQVEAFLASLNSSTVEIFNGSNFIRDTTLAPALNAAAGGVQASSPTPGETHLTQAQLDSVVAAAIGLWAAAGATDAQLAALHATTFSVSNLSDNTIGEQTPGHITIDADAAGHGWFVDPTPNDNSEFTHAQNAAGTDLLTDPSSAAAGHLDLLTTVTHELGHVLGLDDETAASDANDLMYINLVDGERRLPDGADVGQSLDGTAVAGIKMPTVGLSPAPIPTSAAAPPQGGAPIVAGNDTIDAGFGGKTLVGSAGADNFVFGSDIHLGTPTAPSAQPITHVADYSAAQGDTFDFSVLTSAFHALNVADASLVRAVEDPNGTFAMLQLNIAVESGGVTRFSPPAPAAPVADWVNVAQIDGAHTGDPVNVLIDSQAAIHLAQIHVGLLV